MRNFTAPMGLLIILAAFATSPMLRAQEAISSRPLLLAEVTATEQSDVIAAKDPGIGVFSSLPVRLSVYVHGGYDDNVTTSKEFKQGSPFTDVGATLNYDFGSARTQLNLEVGAAFTYYWENVEVPGLSLNDYDINTYIRFGLTHKASPRLTLVMADYLTYKSEPDIAIGQGSNRRAGNYFYTQDKFTANYLWAPRFATATSYTLGALKYEDAVAGLYQDRWDNTIGNEFRYLLAPTSALVVEYRFESISYQNINRDSTTHFALGGFDHTFDPQWNMSVRGGAQFRHYDQGENRTAPYFEGTLTYTAGKRTTVTWTNRYAIEEPDILLSQGRDTFRTGLTAKHEFTSKITGSAGIYYEHDDYKSLNQPGVFSPAFTEQVFDLAFGLHYAITRYVGVEIGYNFTDVSSDASARSYTRNRYSGGVNVSF
jgi:hypothetical protein